VGGWGRRKCWKGKWDNRQSWQQKPRGWEFAHNAILLFISRLMTHTRRGQGPHANALNTLESHAAEERRPVDQMTVDGRLRGTRSSPPFQRFPQTAPTRAHSARRVAGMVLFGMDDAAVSPLLDQRNAT
jgi:hypothetical protein